MEKGKQYFVFSQLPILIILAFALDRSGLKNQKVFLSLTASPEPLKKKAGGK